MASRETKSIIELEGMAIVGLLKDVKLEDCSEPSGWKKLVAMSIDGDIYETKCIEPQAAKRNYMVISTYTTRWSSSIRGSPKVDNQ